MELPCRWTWHYLEAANTNWIILEAHLQGPVLWEGWATWLLMVPG